MISITDKDSLIIMNVDPSLADEEDRNSLHYAFRRNAPRDVIKFLVRYGYSNPTFPHLLLPTLWL